MVNSNSSPNISYRHLFEPMVFLIRGVTEKMKGQYMSPPACSPSAGVNITFILSGLGFNFIQAMENKDAVHPHFVIRETLSCVLSVS